MSSVEKLPGEGWGAVGSWVAEAELQPGDRKCGCLLGTCPLAPRLQHWSPPSTPNEQRWALVTKHSPAPEKSCAKRGCARGMSLGQGAGGGTAVLATRASPQP